ncbi:hypothetical protein AB4Y89_06265 [Terriglobus sp. 2YAB30_2]|uniref:hypothetical protein n=1 Tax=unclassified Terriglobus TaxID=2628988 RepID=UPI003F9601B8
MATITIPSDYEDVAVMFADIASYETKFQGPLTAITGTVEYNTVVTFAENTGVPESPVVVTDGDLPWDPTFGLVCNGTAYYQQICEAFVIAYRKFWKGRAFGLVYPDGTVADGSTGNFSVEKLGPGRYSITVQGASGQVPDARATPYSANITASATLSDEGGGVFTVLTAYSDQGSTNYQDIDGGFSFSVSWPRKQGYYQVHYTNLDTDIGTLTGIGPAYWDGSQWSPMTIVEGGQVTDSGPDDNTLITPDQSQLDHISPCLQPPLPPPTAPGWVNGADTPPTSPGWYWVKSSDKELDLAALLVPNYSDNAILARGGMYSLDFIEYFGAKVLDLESH